MSTYQHQLSWQVDAAAQIIQWSENSPFHIIMSLVDKADEWIEDTTLNLLTKKVLLDKSKKLLNSDSNYIAEKANSAANWLVSAFLLMGKANGLSEDDAIEATDTTYITEQVHPIKTVQDVEFENGEG